MLQAGQGSKKRMGKIFIGLEKLVTYYLMKVTKNEEEEEEEEE